MSGDAKYLAQHPVLAGLFDQLEKSALGQAIYAPINDDETRRNLLAEVRAIRSVRSKLVRLADGDATATDDTGA